MTMLSSFHQALDIIMHPDRHVDSDGLFDRLRAKLTRREQDLLRDLLRELTCARRDRLVNLALEAMGEGDDINDDRAFELIGEIRDLLVAWKRLERNPLDHDAATMATRITTVTKRDTDTIRHEP